MNMQNLMAQAQRMKNDIQRKQKEINEKEFISETEGFKLTINGKKEIVSLSINKEIIKDSDDLDALEDMIKIAFNDASKKVDNEIEKKLGGYATGLNGLI